MAYDRAEYIRLRVEVLARPPAPRRARGRRPWRPRVDQCKCGRSRDGAHRRCSTCRAGARNARDQRIAEGICAESRSHGAAAPGNKLCPACRERARAQTAAAKALVRASRALTIRDATDAERDQVLADLGRDGVSAPADVQVSIVEVRP
jgi:hypothetical protein